MTSYLTKQIAMDAMLGMDPFPPLDLHPPYRAPYVVDVVVLTYPLPQVFG
jgi:hypothetical protein